MAERVVVCVDTRWLGPPCFVRDVSFFISADFHLAWMHKNHIKSRVLIPFFIFVFYFLFLQLQWLSILTSAFNHFIHLHPCHALSYFVFSRSVGYCKKRRNTGNQKKGKMPRRISIPHGIQAVSVIVPRIRHHLTNFVSMTCHPISLIRRGQCVASTTMTTSTTKEWRSDTTDTNLSSKQKQRMCVYPDRVPMWFVDAVCLHGV